MILFDIADLVKDQSTIYGVAGTIFGAFGLEVLRRWFSKSDKKLDDAAKIRSELWDELGRVRDEVRRVQNELDEWKEKYFKIYEDNAHLNRENIELRSVNKALVHMVTELGGDPNTVLPEAEGE